MLSAGCSRSTSSWRRWRCGVLAAAAMTRTEVRDAVGCPACKAERGEQCRRLRGGPRESNHGERVKAAEAAVLERDWDRGDHGPDDRDLDRGELGARGTATQAGEPV